MIKVIAVVAVGLMLTGCSVSNLSELGERMSAQEPGSLIVVCPDGKVILNTRNQNCFSFMETEAGS